MFERWIERGKPLGYDNGRTMINIYDQEVKKLNTSVIRERSSCCNALIDTDEQSCEICSNCGERI